jgi:tetratricopeptide (TPR) repeat protein
MLRVLKIESLWIVAAALWSTSAWCDDDQSCSRVNEPKLAIPACERLLKSGHNVKRNIVLSNLGAALTSAGEYDRAGEVLTEALRLDATFAFAWENRALNWYRMGEIEKSLKDLDEALRLNPKLDAAYNTRGLIDLDTGDNDRCLIDFNQLVRMRPKDAFVYNNRALCFQHRGEYDKATKDFDEAIRLQPKWDRLWANRGDTYRLQGDLDRALQDQNKAIELNPDSALNYNLRGDTYRYRGDLDLALADYDKAIALSSDQGIPPHTGKGLTFEKKGDLARARAEFERAMAIQSTDKSDLNRSALETAKARLAALDSGAAQPIIPAAPTRAASATSIPTLAAVVPASIAAKARPAGGRRVALVFGNSAYRKVPELANPKRDADVMARTLRAIGFDSVTIEIDDNREKMIAALRKFAGEADSADWAIVYYAGHGLEMGGVNYLIPVDAELKADRDVQFETVPFDQVSTAIEGARKLKLVLLDACRDNPFELAMRKTTAPDGVISASTAGAKVGSRSISRGLGEVKVSGASLVVFAAKQGQVALDGEGGDSPFAVAVVQRIATPGVEINKVFRLVRDDVMEATAGRQEPYTYGSLPGSEDFFFVAK